MEHSLYHTFFIDYILLDCVHHIFEVSSNYFYVNKECLNFQFYNAEV